MSAGGSPSPVDLTVIVVSHNTRALLRDCLDSVELSLAGVSAEVIVVDNASTDGSARMVRQFFPRAHVIENADNRGFAAANNQALARARGAFVALLNPDTIVLDRTLARLVQYLGAHAAVGAAGPSLVQPNGGQGVVAAGYQPTLSRMVAHALALPRLFPRRCGAWGIHLPGTPDGEPREVEWLSGACLVVRREVVADVGPLSETWFLYAEDMEWCDRMVRHGWRLRYLPHLRVVHYGGASVRQGPPRLAVQWVESFTEHYSRRCRASRPRRALFAVAFSAGWALRALASCALAVRPSANRRRQFASALVALRYAGAGLRWGLTSPASPARRRTGRGR